jgi:hypothetical protein
VPVTVFRYVLPVPLVFMTGPVMLSQLMLYSALSLWLALKLWARYDPDPALYPHAVPMTEGEFNWWYAVEWFLLPGSCVPICAHPTYDLCACATMCRSCGMSRALAVGFTCGCAISIKWYD